MLSVIIYLSDYILISIIKKLLIQDAMVIYMDILFADASYQLGKFNLEFILFFLGIEN